MNKLAVIEHKEQKVLTTAQLRTEYNKIKLKDGFKFVYAIETQQGIKIGITNNPKSRILGLGTISGLDITQIFLSIPCSNSREVESNLHSLFKENRNIGEWFSVPFQNACEIIMAQSFKQTKKEKKSNLNLFNYFNEGRKNK